jgi:hypothetical protein
MQESTDTGRKQGEETHQQQHSTDTNTTETQGYAPRTGWFAAVAPTHLRSEDREEGDR